jgi:type IX secretion system PorP/SprF family membrane protein
MKCLSNYCLLLIALFVIGQSVQAQQIPQFTQHRLTELFYNPAYTGNSTDIYIETVARGQWLGIDGRPLTAAIAAHTAIPLLKGGAGISIINDMLGVERHTAAYLLYSYKKNFKNNQQIAIGIEIGAIQKQLDGSRLITPEGNYQGGINHNDNALPNTTASSIGFDVGLGIRYHNKRYTIGIAAKQLYSTALVLDNAKINLTPHAIIYTNYRFVLTNTLTLEPAILLKTDFKQYQPDFTLSAYWGDNWITALALRGIGDRESAGAIVAAQLNKKWRVGYSYDFPLSALNNATNGSHEITLQYRISNKFKTKQGKKTYNPRFL